MTKATQTVQRKPCCCASPRAVDVIEPQIYLRRYNPRCKEGFQAKSRGSVWYWELLGSLDGLPNTVHAAEKLIESLS